MQVLGLRVQVFRVEGSLGFLFQGLGLRILGFGHLPFTSSPCSRSLLHLSSSDDVLGVQ